MCIIISVDKDHATDEVIDWIDHLGGKFSRINITNDIENQSIFFSISNDKQEEFLKNETKGWLRKDGRFRELNSYKNMLSEESFDLTNYLYLELSVLRKFYFRNNDIKWIGNPKYFHISKIEVLNRAQENNIDIPSTFVINTKKSLIEIFNSFNGKIITKSLSDVPRFKKDGKIYTPLTYKIEKEDIDILPETFFPTLIQPLIEKDFEIRSFYLEGEFYSAAIFSQSDPQTKTDFRRYNYNKPNRLIPYSLPKTIEVKLNKLCKDCNITTGSIDIMKGTDEKFYFLEINQGGQFGMVSRPCNYKLEKRIATKLL